MKSNRFVVGLVSIFVLLLLLSAGCKRTVAVDSKWAGSAVVVDGQDSEWRDSGLYFDETTNTRIGIRNDAQALYLCLIFREDNLQRTISQNGLVLWVCRDKRSNKLWGLRYPTGGEGAGEMGGPGGPEGGGGPGRPENNGIGYIGDRVDPVGGQVDDRADAGERQAQVEETIGGPGGPKGHSVSTKGVYELLAPEDEQGEVITTEALADHGIQCRFSSSQGGGIVYEIKIPLYKTDKTPYVAVASGKEVCFIGLVSEGGETPKMGAGGRDGGMDGGRGGSMGGFSFSDMGGGSMGRGQMGGEMGRGGMPAGAGSSAMDMWARIQLASPPAD